MIALVPPLPEAFGEQLPVVLFFAVAFAALAIEWWSREW